MSKHDQAELSIINKPGAIFFKGCFLFYAKRAARTFLGIQRGPDVVLKSLIRGLDLTDAKYNINPSLGSMSETVHVISSPKALAWAIEQKKLGKIRKLVAGPNISILPSLNGRILCAPEIDIILLPSQWTKEAYAKDEPSIAPKIQVWPSGVSIPLEPRASSETSARAAEKGMDEKFYLLYKKNFPENDYLRLAAMLTELKVPFKTLVYGKFKQQEYFDLLKNAKALIYLQIVESQGIALQEAWARDVPALVWNSKKFAYPSGLTVYGSVSAPYLTDECGMFFDSIDNFKDTLASFEGKLKAAQFEPRKYCASTLSDAASVTVFLKQVGLEARFK